MTAAVFFGTEKVAAPPLAVEFRRRKWMSRREEVRSAAEFIGQGAFFSSATDKPYRIRWSDGREKLSGAFFKAQLSLLESRAVRHSG